MGNYTFGQIKCSVLQWINNDLVDKLIGNDELEITKDEEDVLLVDLTFKYCLAQIVVTNPTFAPYQFVSFEAATWDSKKAEETETTEMIYFFYDHPNMTEKQVLMELKYGLKLCSEYIPNQLSEVYMNKKGFLNVQNEDVYHIVHPDDVKIFNIDLIENDFICIGTEAQYLIVKNKTISLRVLPQIFSVIQ